MDEGDPYFEPLDRDLDRWDQRFGLRYDFTGNAAIKLEAGFGQAERRRDNGDITTGSVVLAAIQVSWVF